jgi:hypothetical protein
MPIKFFLSIWELILKEINVVFYLGMFWAFIIRRSHMDRDLKIHRLEILQILPVTVAMVLVIILF